MQSGCWGERVARCGWQVEKSRSSRDSTTRHAGVVGLWGAPPQRPPGASPNGNCRNGAILARSKTAPLPVPPSKRMKSPSNIMRQSSLTKLGSMINTAVNKRVGEFFFFFISRFPFVPQPLASPFHFSSSFFARFPPEKTLIFDDRIFPPWKSKNVGNCKKRRGRGGGRYNTTI